MIMEDLFGKMTSEQRFEGNEGQSHVDDQGTQASKYEDPEMGKFMFKEQQIHQCG